MTSFAEICAAAHGQTDEASGVFGSSRGVVKPRVMPRILLVDDDPVFGRIMKRAAASFAARLAFVQSVDELTDEHLSDVDVAIIDFDLGAVTGLELARFVDDRVPMPVVLVSTTERRPDERWSESIHDFLVKESGPLAIMDAAFEAHEVARLLRQSPGAGRRVDFSTQDDGPLAIIDSAFEAAEIARMDRQIRRRARQTRKTRNKR